MGLQKLNTISSYEEINGGAHRKPASILGAPSLVRRIGFWNAGFVDQRPQRNLSEKPRSGGNRTWLDPVAYAAAHTKYLRDLQKVLASQGERQVHIELWDFVHCSDLVPQSGTVSLVRFWWYGIRATIRLEYHTEYMTLTSMLDLSVKPNVRYRRTAGDLQSQLEQAMDLLGELFSSPRPKSRERYRRIGYFQDVVWEQFERTILNGFISKRPILEGSLGEVFADFRGMVTGSEIEAPRSWPPVTSSERFKQRLFRTFRSDLPRRRESSRRHREPPLGWSRDTLSRLWPLMEAHEFLRDYEFTVGGFLGGRVLYVSALGPQALENRNETWPWAPVYYYLHAYTDDEWQIGRLVDRINTLGTLRLATTMQIGDLLKAGKLVDELSGMIDDTATFLQAAIKDTKSRAGEAASDIGDEACDVSQSARATPVEVADEKMVDVQVKLHEVDQTVSGDVAYRLERSHYYLQQFAREAEGLRERRVEGYQKYQEFVMRRMGSVFGYIDLLRTRMQTIDAGIAGLGRQYASLKIASVTCSIDGLVTSMEEQNREIQAQNDLMAQQHVDMEKQEREIRKIQEFGEAALVGVLIPYYLGVSVIHYLLHFEGHREQVAWLVVLTTCAFILLGRLYTQRKHDPEAATRLRLVQLVTWIYLVAIWGAAISLKLLS